jgi:histidine ammonia-lyase
LALINGTQQSTATLTLALADAEELMIAALGAVALTVEGLFGSTAAFDERVQRVRPHPGQQWAAAGLRALLEGSEIVRAHADCGRVQDPYSMRCAPQVIGAAVDALCFASEVCARERRSATDNPLVFADAPPEAPWRLRVVSAGNFHAQPVSLAADVASVALATVASIAERRMDLLLDEKKSGLPAFLASDPGLHSGLMIVQYTAAALVSENKTLAHPASVDTIPTSAGMEDHVSMAPWAARKLRRVVENARRVVAAEYLVAAEAVERRAPLQPARPTRALHAAVRERVPRLDGDRPPAPDVEALARWIEEGGVRRALPEGVVPRPLASEAAPVAGRST